MQKRIFFISLCHLFAGVILLAMNSPLSAAQCLDVFASGAQTSTPSLILPSFLNSSSPNNQLGSSLSIAAGQYKTVEVSKNGSANFTTIGGVYRIKTLTLKTNAVATLAPGDYWIDQLKLGQNSSIFVSGTGTVRIYSNNISISKGANIAIGTPYLIMIGYGSVSIDKNVNFAGVLYSTKQVEVEKNTTISGAVHANQIQLDNNVAITYNSNLITGADFNGMCNNVASLTIDHIQIINDGSALTCSDEILTIKACANAACSTVATSDIMATLTATGAVSSWSQNPITIPANSNTGITVNLTHRTAETVTLGATSVPAATNAVVCSPVGCNLTFSEAGYILSLPSHQSCSIPNLTIQAVKLSATGTSCAPAYTGNQSVDFSFNYNNPATGNRIPILDATNMAAATLIQNRTINFDPTASAVLSFEYRDAGQINITVSDAAGAGLTSAMVSPIVVPAKLLVSTVDANNACVGPDFGNCTAFKVAGTVANVPSQFNLDVAGACADNSITPNFQLNNIPLSSNLVSPAGGTNATLGVSSVNITTGGTVTVSQTVSEVGAFSITATPAPTSYLGQSIPAVTSATIGRFIPDRFIITDNAPLFTNSTCDFTYQGQAFDFAPGLSPALTLTAVNSAGATTVNYGGAGVANHDFWKLNGNLLFSRSYSNQVLTFPGTLTASLGAIDTAGNINYDGVNTFSFIADQLTYNKAAVVPAALPAALNDAAFNASVKLNLTAASLTDSDGVFYDPDNNGIIDVFASNNITGTNIRWGRWFIDNSFGSELLPLQMVAQAQYFDGTNFVINTTDNASVACTTSTPLTTTLSNYTGNLAVGETTLTQSAITSGLIPLTFSAPGNGNDGSLLITLTTPLWMSYDFNGDTIAENASATATFGIFEGRKPVIFWRQKY